MHIGITIGEVVGAVALGLIIVTHTASGVQAAGLFVAGIHQFTLAEATLVGIAHAAIHAGTFKAAGQLNALGVNAARIVGTATIERLTLCGRIAKEVRWAGALCLAVDHTALCIAAAGTQFQTGIAALALITALARIAVRVLATLELHTFLARLTLVAIGAVAEHAMLRNGAQRIPATGTIIGTGICALSIHTALISGTISVRLAASNAGSTFAELSQLALTLGSALVAALATCTLLSTGAVLAAGTLGSTIGTALIALTARMATLWWQLAARESVSDEGSRTLALHAMIDDQTVGTLATLSWCLAGILTLLIDASLVAGTAQIVATACLADAILADLSLSTCAVRVADSAAGATHATLIGQTVLIIAALALTAAGIAQLISSAILVAATGSAWLLAGNIRISIKSLGAAALLAMIQGLADGIGATCRGIRTGIHTLLCHTSQLTGATLIGATARHTVETQTEFSMGAFVVVAAEGLTDTLLATLIGKAARIVGTEWTTDRFKAGQAIATVTILMALKWGRTHTTDLRCWVGHHVVQAAAAGTMIRHRAGSIGSTRILQAGIDALVVATRLRCTAIVVHMATIDALVVQANVAQEAVVIHAARD